MWPWSGPDLKPGQTATKIGFNTVAMWGLCVVVIVVCYGMEQRDLALNPPKAPLPTDVQKVLPSGQWLMRDGSIKAPQQ
jgi:hypothetical protein